MKDHNSQVTTEMYLALGNLSLSAHFPELSLAVWLFCSGVTLPVWFFGLSSLSHALKATCSPASSQPMPIGLLLAE